MNEIVYKGINSPVWVAIVLGALAIGVIGFTIWAMFKTMRG
jgi:hypothetical protein